MLQALTILLVYQAIGEMVARGLHLPLPGPVLGMLLLFATLSWRGKVPASLRDASSGILQHLALFFIPAAVGVVAHLQRVAQEWIPIVAAVAGGTVISIAVSAVTMQALMRLTGHESAPEEDA